MSDNPKTSELVERHHEIMQQLAKLKGRPAEGEVTKSFRLEGEVLTEMVQDWLIQNSGEVPIDVKVQVGIGEIFVTATVPAGGYMEKMVKLLP